MSYVAYMLDLYTLLYPINSHSWNGNGETWMAIEAEMALITCGNLDAPL